MSNVAQPIVKMLGITKSFPGVIANKNVDFEAYAGEIHGLLGENGAGKSTLMNILSGVYKPDAGEIYVEGKSVKMRSPADAIKLGIGTVYQHFSLIKKFSVLDNLLLATPNLNRNEIKRRFFEIASLIGFKTDPNILISNLTVGEQQRIEIVKILMQGAKIIILDEPTSILSPVEVDNLFKILRQLANANKCVIFISHKLDEVLHLCDRFTILRSGVKVGTLSRSELNLADQLISMMFGTSKNIKTHGLKQDDLNALMEKSEALRVESLYVDNDFGLPAVNDANISVYEGEILGIAGIEGNGQRELAEALAGIRRIKSGALYLYGKKLEKIDPITLYSLGIRYIPEDRLNEGLVPAFNVPENLMIKSHLRHKIIHWKTLRSTAERIIREYKITVHNPMLPVYTLSGGNMQKLLVARELMDNPKILIACQPTHGLDYKTTQYIHYKFQESVKTGTSVILISNDLDEILLLSNRVGVMYNGRIIGVYGREKFNRDLIGRLMVGKDI